MTDFRVELATEAHLAQVKPRGVCYPPGVQYGLTENSYVFIFKGNPVAVIGGIVAAGLMNTWGVISDDVEQCPVQFHNAVKRLMREMIEKHRLRRMQMTVRVGYEKGAEWAGALGFSREGTMRKFEADGEDAWLYGRTT